MKIYFLSSLPCLMTVNGAYFGRTDTFARSAEVCAKDEVFVEFHPENALPLGFFITEKLPFSPPHGCEVYLLPDAIAIFAKEFTPRDFTLRPILQRRIEDDLVTVFAQGGVQVCVESPENTFVSPLPLSFLPTNARRVNKKYLLTSDDFFIVLDEHGKTLLQERYESLEIDGTTLRAVLPVQDRKSRKVRCAWDLALDCKRIEFTLLQPQEEEKDGLLAYAFFESVLLGEDYDRFLCDNLKIQAKKLSTFLGNFLAVLPTDDDNVCHLVYQKAERLYEVKAFTVTIAEGQITDIQG